MTPHLNNLSYLAFLKQVGTVYLLEDDLQRESHQFTYCIHYFLPIEPRDHTTAGSLD